MSEPLLKSCVAEFGTQPTQNLYVICGPSGSGKTTLLKSMVEQGFCPVISTTTRPRRKGETNEYNFVSWVEFMSLSDLVESTEYGGYLYGIQASALEKGDFVVVEPNGVKHLKSHYRGRPIKVIGLRAPIDVLRSRIMSRGSEALYRLNVDIAAFKGFEALCDIVIESESREQTLSEALRFIVCNES